MHTKTKNTFNLGLFIISIATPLAAGILGGLATNSQVTTWYTHLDKPAFNPPNWIFGPVWTALYALQGIALYAILNQHHKPRRLAIGLFATQIILNTAWSLIFFGLHQPVWALAEIVFLWGFIVMTMWSFHTIRPEASQLFWPYLAWVTFATVLNASIVVLNYT